MKRFEIENFGKYWQTGSDALTGSYFKDPLLVGEAIKQGRVANNPDYLFDYLFFDPGVKADADKSSLALTRYFQEPLGAMIARTGWEGGLSSNTVVAEMKVGAMNFANHQHADAGSFQLYYKGPLAPESGIYEGGNGAYGSDHFKNYYQRTIAHNSMLVYDPGEKFLWHREEVANDGGQQSANRGDEPRNLEMLLKYDYKTGKVLAHHFGPDPLKPEFSYLKGELADAYSEKIKSFTRSFVFLNLNSGEVPAALIIFDRVSASDKDFKKFWLLHSVEEPVVSGNTTVISRTEKGYNGKMVNRTLLPENGNLIINKVGGAGKEYFVFGRDYPPTFSHPGKNSADSAMWRIEVSPRSAAATDHFLNVMQVMDYQGGPGALPVAKVETERMVGTRIGDRLVLFSKDGNLIDGQVRLKIAEKGNVRVLLTDLKEGEWKIQRLRDKQFISSIERDDQVLYFIADRGEYLIYRTK